ncbi:uncharacterized protein [Haliotis asinina]|uniref:uncharacterized protein n=1 Tax=Haliotis asinina TaxID=109174 RepID=UPI003531E8B0
MAAKRLGNTEKKLSKDSNIAEAFENIMSSYLQKGYIRKLSAEETEPEDKWYLPHFPVVRMDRTKIRIDFDTSAESKGTSLNSVIDQGPKLQRDIVDALLQFRRHQVVVISDTAEISSPFLAQFDTTVHAEDNKREFQLAAETVLKSTYMDDCMDSVTYDETEIELHRQLSQLWTRANMHARKWLSNSVKLLNEIPEKDRANEIDLVEGHLPSEKTI